ncbi:FUSC family protein [Streptomyces sp. 8L]|uniref:FUSC family protein n=1 Tax=Streptomyces sp. 8L TaxID=2877242 RepID=UPI001CD4EEB4|nr:aromatic acid exporter family protein [Streptomyces sp. 8L]MCA1223609.1 aromatic acid exporter family protein [Streptomyces sp. 8L]
MNGGTVAVGRWIAWEAAAVGRTARYAVASPGPERDAVVQSLKASAAAVLAWALAGWFFRAPLALMAPWTALALVDATVYRSVRSGLQQFAVIAVGAVAASLAMAVTGGRTLGAMALALPFLVLAGTYRRLGRQGIYGATTALFVITYGTYTLPALGYRLAETAVGAVIGIGVNAFVLPPVHLRNVRDQMRRLAHECADLLALIADDIGDKGPEYGTAEARDRVARLETVLGALFEARRWTTESLRVNPGRRLRRRPGPEPPPPEEDARWQAVVGHLAGAVRILSNVTGDGRALPVLPPDFLEQYGVLVGRVAHVCATWADALREPGTGGADRETEAARAAWAALEPLADGLPRRPGPTAAVCGGLLTETRLLLALLTTRQEEDPQTGAAQDGGL